MTTVSQSKEVPIPTVPVTEFTETGQIEPTVNSVFTATTVSLIKSGQPVTNGVPDSTIKPNSASGSTIISADVVALKQKNILHENGFAGDQDMSNAFTAFGNNVNNLASLVSVALSLSSLRKPKPNDPRNTTDNYFLTQAEKTLLETRANQFASPGIIPYDALEDFLYVLVYINNYDDLKYISAVTGVAGLDNRSLLRQPTSILNLADLYKVGYLANGVCSITRRFSSKYPNAIYAADNSAGSFGALSTLNNIATSYGAVQSTAVLGSALSSFTDPSGNIKLPGLNQVTNAISSISSQAAAVYAITVLFSSSPIGTSLGLLSSVTSSLNTLSGGISSTVSLITTLGVQAYSQIADGLSSLVKRVEDTTTFTSQLSTVSTSISASKMGDISSQLTKINSLVVGLVSSIGSLTSLVNSLTGNMGDVSKAATVMLSRTGGLSTSSFLTELSLGQRVPPSMICNNPMMQPPSFVGRSYFGEGMTPRMAVDQMYCRRIATYPNSQSGSGVLSFQMQNFGSYGDQLTLTQLVTKVLFGVTSIASTSPLTSVVTTYVNNLTNVLGVQSSTKCELRRSDNSIPLMVGMSAVFAGETKSPFGIDNLAGGWKTASSVGNDVQKYNPSFLTVCRGL